MSLRTSLRSCSGFGEGKFIDLFVAVDDVPRLVVDGVFAVSLGGGALPTSWEGSAFERSTYSGISISYGSFREKSLGVGNACGS